MRILAIETSCDETACAILETGADGLSVRANVVSSQASLHAKWGGVVPDLAAREHTKNIVPVIEETLSRAGLVPKDINLLAVTEGPGLIPALMIGVTAAKTLSLVWNKPLIGIHHIEGHIYANFVEKKKTDTPKFPLLALVVSGGHTELVLMRDHLQYEILGETKDDAVGEAFDKVAKILGLSYPGGPVVAKRADEFKESETFNVHFPRPMIDSDDYDFSFSGLKTAVLYFVQKNVEHKTDERFIDAVCHEFQEAVTEVLLAKTGKAIQEFQPKTVVIAGGVSANVTLRSRLATLVETLSPDTVSSTPEFAYSLDNAVMIGAAAAYRYERMPETEHALLFENRHTLNPNANLKLRSMPEQPKN